MIGSLLTDENRNAIYRTLNITGVGTNPKVYTVTRTDDYDDDRNPSRYEGTLRYALEAGTGPRIIKFQLPDNSQIFLKKPLLPKEGNFIVDGKSGAVNLQISGFGLVIENLSNFVFDNIRFYRGDRAIFNKTPYNDGKDYRRKLDTLEILTASRFAFFNCEFAWGADGLADLFNVKDGILHGCLLPHPLANPEVHYEGGRAQRHDFGGSVRGGYNFSIVNCFIGPVKERGLNFDMARANSNKMARADSSNKRVLAGMYGCIIGYIKNGTKINEPETGNVNAQVNIQDCIYYAINDPTSGINISDAKSITIERQKDGSEVNLVNNFVFQNRSMIDMPVTYKRQSDSQFVKRNRKVTPFTYYKALDLHTILNNPGMPLGAQPPNEYTLSIKRDILAFTGKPLLSQDDLRLTRALQDEHLTTSAFLPSGGPHQKAPLLLTPNASSSEDLKSENRIRAKL